MGEYLLGDLLFVKPRPRLDDPIRIANGDEGNARCTAEFLYIAVVAGTEEVVDEEVEVPLVAVVRFHFRSESFELFQ